MRKKDYPKSLTVKGETYEVKFANKLGKDILAYCDPCEREIKIKNGQTKEETLKCFIHEVLHALEFEHHIKIKHKTVYQLEEAIFRFLRDNYL